MLFVTSVKLRGAQIKDDSVLILWSPGVQVGDHGFQRNDFHYVVTGRVETRDLLTTNPNLAQEILNAVVPREERGWASILRPSPQASVGVRRQVRDLDLSSLVSGLGVQVGPPDPGQLLTIRASDGVTVGAWNRQSNSYHVDSRIRIT